MNIWVNGCFDILHSGHINLLEFAKNLHGEPNVLIVGIDSDRRVKELKGNDRPINDQEERKRILEALKPVDKVVIYDTDEEMCKFIGKFFIDYMVVGEEYRTKEVLCREWSENDVVFFHKNEKSTTELFKKIRKI